MTSLWRRLTAAVRRLDTWPGPTLPGAPAPGPHRCYATTYSDGVRAGGGRHRAACGCVAAEHTAPDRHWRPAIGERITSQPRPTGGTAAFTAPRQNGKVTAMDLLGIAPNMPDPRPPATDRPRPGSLTEMGQRVADGLAPWFDRMADTTQLPVVIHSDTTQTYGRADRI
jgi:hypothetical protein